MTAPTATPYSRRAYPGGATETTIPAGLNADATQFIIQDNTDWPDGADGKWFVGVELEDSNVEKILCLSRDGFVVTIDPSGRGADNPDGTGLAHPDGAPVVCIGAAQDFDEANELVNFLAGDDSGDGAGSDFSFLRRRAAANDMGLEWFDGVPQNLGVAKTTSMTSSLGATTSDIALLTESFTGLASTDYRVTWKLRVVVGSSAGASDITVLLRNGASTTIDELDFVSQAASATHRTLKGSTIWRPGATAVTPKLSVTFSANIDNQAGGQSGNIAFLMIEQLT